MAKSKNKTKKAIIKLIKSTFSGWTECEVIDVKAAYRLPDKKIKIQLKEYPMEVHLFPDSKSLQIYPEKSLADNPERRGHCEFYILFDPENYYSDISGFYRLGDGDKITLGGEGNKECSFLNISENTPSRKLTISNDEGRLTFKSHMAKPQSSISPLFKDKKVNQILAWRRKKLQCIRDIFGGPLALLSPEDALVLIRQVNGVMENEPYRPKDKSERPGGVVVLPKKSTVIIVGDLHAKLDNLLVVLTQNGFLDALVDKRASMIILGDAVHPEGEVPLDEMESSMLMMDFIFKLKVRFPEQVFYIRGNHDSFSEDLAKGGIPQGILWENTLYKTRGKAYKKEMNRFYELLPYLAYSKYFIACHAAPPTSSVSLHALINIRGNSKLIKQLINNRLKHSNRPSGYTRSDVKRLRKCLGVAKDTPVIVGHTPMSLDDTVWEDVGDIKNHIILYSSDLEWVGVMAQISNKLSVLRYPTEELAPLINDLSGD